jgi:hypothetical protein
MNYKNILIIGHELHSHTHSYIFNGIYKALIALNYNVDWIHNDNDIYKIKSLNSSKINIIITELYYNKNIPIIENCTYIIQQPFLELFKKSDNSYETDDFMKSYFKNIPKQNIILWRPYINQYADNFFQVYKKNEYTIIVTPWATDLLPNEIDENIKNLESFNIKDISNFIGMPLKHNEELKDTLKKYNIDYAVYGGTFDKNSERNKSIEENMKLIQESIIAPALQSDEQIEKNYIPCRIFKNISYGKMGITNNEAVYNLFNKKIIYSKNIAELVDKSLEFNKNDKNRFSIIKELMIEVRDNHTYINRINFILKSILDQSNICKNI